MDRETRNLLATIVHDYDGMDTIDRGLRSGTVEHRAWSLLTIDALRQEISRIKSSHAHIEPDAWLKASVSFDLVKLPKRKKTAEQQEWEDECKVNDQAMR